MEITRRRNARIDYLRALGTFLVVIAHVNAPGIIQSVRSFDVIMLVFISGMTSAVANIGNYRQYLYKRFRKLVVPTYCLLAFVFGASYLLCNLMDWEQLYTVQEMALSPFFVTGGMAFIWIVRVYMIIAACMPVLQKIANKITSVSALIWSNVLIGLLLVVLYCINSHISEGMVHTVFEDFIYSGAVYLYIALLGIVFEKEQHLRKILEIAVVAIFVVTQVYYIIEGTGFSPNTFKFPPQIYYCIYGLICTMILYHIMPDRSLTMIQWISSNSFKIYLWHVVMLRVYGAFAKVVSVDILNFWWVEYIAIMCGSIFLTAMFNRIFEWIRIHFTAQKNIQ